jgi:hypothetical protein
MRLSQKSRSSVSNFESVETVSSRTRVRSVSGVKTGQAGTPPPLGSWLPPNRWMAQEQNLVIGGAMTDPKGDRSKGPSEQEDPDVFVRVVERRPDGLVIRGAKAHQTGCINSHWILVMPTMRLSARDRDYAVVCAVPVDAPGLTISTGGSRATRGAWRGVTASGVATGRSTNRAELLRRTFALELHCRRIFSYDGAVLPARHGRLARQRRARCEGARDSRRARRAVTKERCVE